MANAVNNNRKLSYEELSIIDAICHRNEVDFINYGYLENQFSDRMIATDNVGNVLRIEDIVNEKKATREQLTFSAHKFVNIGLYLLESAISTSDDGDGMATKLALGIFFSRGNLCELLDGYMEQVMAEMKCI